MKIVYLFIGFISLGLGTLGAVLPILPTVPFLLVSAFCFGKSSHRVNDWFIATSLYKNHLESYVAGNGMTYQTKCRIVCMVSALMLIGFIMMKETQVGRMMLVLVWVGHMWYFIFRVKNIKE